MKYRTRIYYTETDKALMWEKWRQGETLGSIARHFDRHHSAVGGILARTGGIRPTQRTRSSSALMMTEREEILRGIVAQASIRAIAQKLGRSPSTISREIKRNGGRSNYRAIEADQAAWDRSLRPKTCKLVINGELAQLVASKLKKLWSPTQIAGWLKRMYPDDAFFQVSHETIYRSLYIQPR